MAAKFIARLSFFVCCSLSAQSATKHAFRYALRCPPSSLPNSLSRFATCSLSVPDMLSKSSHQTRLHSSTHDAFAKRQFKTRLLSRRFSKATSRLHLPTSHPISIGPIPATASCHANHNLQITEGEERDLKTDSERKTAKSSNVIKRRGELASDVAPTRFGSSSRVWPLRLMRNSTTRRTENRNSSCDPNIRDEARDSLESKMRRLNGSKMNPEDS